MKEIRVERDALRRELARHRQEHIAATGASRCSRGDWSGPFTIVDDERSFAEHILQVIEGFDLSDFANPECTTCDGSGRLAEDAEACPDCIVGVWA